VSDTWWTLADAETPEGAIEAIATMTPKVYERVRKSLAIGLGMAVEELDALRAKPNGQDQAAKGVEPWDIPPVSMWAARAPPKLRDWIIEDLAIAAGRVTSFVGHGGFGKTTIATQIAIACAISDSLWGMSVNGGSVVGVFCEDEESEIDRRVRLIAEREGIAIDRLDNLHLLSRDGDDNVLASFDHDMIKLTGNYWRLDAAIAQIKPRLTILDTAADMFAGEFMSTTHVRQFLKTALGGYCKRHGTAVMLNAHPSASAMKDGDGAGFSTAWNNSVRSRLYLRTPKSDDREAIADRRVLEIRKSNYGPSGAMIPLIYERGLFVIDREPIEEAAAQPKRAGRADTMLAMAVMAYFREKAPSGQVVTFGAIFEALQKAGDIPKGQYETVRKPLQRTLKSLVTEKLLKDCEVPRGYRMATATAESPA
jgi:hypothetical protein